MGIKLGQTVQSNEKMISRIAKTWAVAAFGASKNCETCLETGSFQSCFSACTGYSPMFLTQDALVEKRGGKLRSLCLNNPRALPCMNALGGNQNSNLMW